MLESYTRELDRLRGVASQLETLLDRLGEDDLTVGARQVKARISARTFNVAVVGAFKAGKSTLTNCLIESELLPTSARECTAVVTRITRSTDDTLTASLFFADGHEEVVDANTLEDRLTVDASPAPVEALLRIPRSSWLPEGIELVDTPGLGAAGLAREEVTLRYLPAADAIIFVTRADQMLTEHEQRFLRDALAPEERSRVFLVVNFADRIRTDDERQQVLTRLGAVIPEAINNDRAHVLSAADGLEGTLDGDTTALTTSGVAAFRDALLAFLQDERAAKDLQRFEQLVMSVMQAADKRLLERRAMRDMESAALQRRRDRIIELATLLRSDGQQLKADAQTAIDSLVTSAKLSLDRSCYELKNTLDNTEPSADAWQRIALQAQSNAQRALRLHFTQGIETLRDETQRSLSRMFDTIELGLDETLALRSDNSLPSGDLLRHHTVVEIEHELAPEKTEGEPGNDDQAMTVVGAGIGAVIGALVAGPFGAAIGASMGAAMGHSETASTVRAVVERKVERRRLHSDGTTDAVRSLLTQRVNAISSGMATQFNSSLTRAVGTKLDDLRQRAIDVEDELGATETLSAAELDTALSTLRALRSA